ncbi:MAG: hypothetical protein ACQES1_05020 [Bacteroidota bacterium]
MLRKTIFILIFLLFITGIYAQNQKPKHQIVFNTSTNALKSSGIEYKRKISDKGYYLNTGIGFEGDAIFQNPKTETNYPIKNIYFAIPVSLGIEKQKTSDQNKLSFVYGSNLLLWSYINYSKYENPNLPIKIQRTLTSDLYWGINFHYGIYYNISDNFSIGSYIAPYIIFNKSESAESSNLKIEYDILSNFSLISVKYSW